MIRQFNEKIVNKVKNKYSFFFFYGFFKFKFSIKEILGQKKKLKIEKSSALKKFTHLLEMTLTVNLYNYV